jgi:hypothetical protein
VVNDSAWLPNVTIIKPPPYRSSILDWSNNFGLYKHAFDYTSKLMNTLKDEAAAPFTG